MDTWSTRVQGSEPFVRQCFLVAMGPHGSAHDKEARLVAAGAQKVEDLTSVSSDGALSLAWRGSSWTGK